MSSKNTRSYAIDGAKLGALTDEMKQHGLTIDTTQPGGNVAHEGFDVDWNVKNDVLTLTLNRHPFAEEGLFWDKVQAIVGEPVEEK